MKVSLNWLRKFTDIKLSDDEIVERIGSRLAEVDSVDKLGDKYKNIVIAEIIEAKAHPDADKLGVYQIDFGKGKTQVVAGDKTLKVGNKVAYIPPGTVVPRTYTSSDPLEIKKTELRGETSDGMLGSASELIFGDDHEGVLRLDTDAEIGASLVEAYELDDIVVEVDNKSLTNRPDCFGMIGFARELAGIQEISFKSPEWWLKPRTVAPASTLNVSVDNQVKDLVPTYLVVAIKDVEIKPSPQIMQTYLTRIGLRPINNIVDATNYLMVMTGQPLHAFDYDKVKNGGLVVRLAEKGEKLKILDGQTLELDGGEIVIADTERALAIGGVMGGIGSEVTEKTKNILLECANFNMYKTRSVSMRHGLFTDAVTRFARGQSPELCAVVAPFAVEQFIDVAGGELASAIAGNQAPARKLEVEAAMNSINKLLGTDLKTAAAAKLLGNVEVETQEQGDKLVSKVPFWRNDLNIVEDIAEEVGRLSGYDNIKATLPKKPVLSTKVSPLQRTKAEIRSILVAAGANELLTYSGISSSLAANMNWPTENLYKIKNSRSPELEYMRPALTGSLLARVHSNHKLGYKDMALFEINPVHNQQDLDEKLPREIQSLAVVVSSVKNPQGAAYYHAKLYLTHLLNHLGVKDVEFKQASEYSGHQYLASNYIGSRSAAVFINGKCTGMVGEFQPSIEKAFKLPENVSSFEIVLDEIVAMDRKLASYKPINKYPVVQRDLTYEVDDKVSFGQLENEMKKYLDSLQENLYKLSATEIYRGKDTGRRITFSLDIWNVNKTLTSKEVNGFIEALAKKLSGALGASQI